jgi:hypothetical protein
MRTFTHVGGGIAHYYLHSVGSQSAVFRSASSPDRADQESRRFWVAYINNARKPQSTYVFSKKWENLRAALALHFAYYNFCRIHGKLRVTPAMDAGIANYVWTIEELVAT